MQQLLVVTSLLCIFSVNSLVFFLSFFLVRLCSAANSAAGAEVVPAVTPLPFRGHSPRVG